MLQDWQKIGGDSTPLNPGSTVPLTFGSDRFRGSCLQLKANETIRVAFKLQAAYKDEAPVTHRVLVEMLDTKQGFAVSVLRILVG